MISGIDERILPLLGESGIEKIRHSKVVVFGLGGVGGTCFEALLRSGVSPLYGVDFDTVEESNLNRQLLFTKKDLGRKKSEAALERAKEIRTDTEVETFDLKVEALSLRDDAFLDAALWIDAVDDLGAKVALVEASLEKGIPLLLSLGMGNRLDPSQVYSMTLDKTSGDPLAKKFRKMLREKGIDLRKITAVCSKELPALRNPKPSSMMMVPSSAGLLLASLSLRKLL